MGVLPWLWWSGVAVAVACADPRHLVAAVPTVAGDTVVQDHASTLFACGSHGDQSADMTQILGVFAAAKAVCCDELEEQCDVSLVPLTCTTAGCARTVSLVAQSCAASFADGFLGAVFKPQLDQVVKACTDAEGDDAPSYVISDPELQVAELTTCQGLLTDGVEASFLIMV
jgi:hypothetical protein